MKNISRKKSTHIFIANQSSTIRMDLEETHMLLLEMVGLQRLRRRERNTEWPSKIRSEAGIKSHFILNKEAVDKQLSKMLVRYRKHQTSVIPISVHLIQLLIILKSLIELETKLNLSLQRIFLLLMFKIIRVNHGILPKHQAISCQIKVSKQ